MFRAVDCRGNRAFARERQREKGIQDQGFSSLNCPRRSYLYVLFSVHASLLRVESGDDGHLSHSLSLPLALTFVLLPKHAEDYSQLIIAETSLILSLGSFILLSDCSLFLSQRSRSNDAVTLHHSRLTLQSTHS